LRITRRALVMVKAVITQIDPAGEFPRTYPRANWPERLQAQWVERSQIVNYPDIIVAEVVAAPNGGTGLFLYSHSLFGWSDMGVNRARVDRWLSALMRAA
jgi:uncharacterized protein (DUF1499 family)